MDEEENSPDDEIKRLLPLLKHTNPSMNESQLRELAKKILTSQSDDYDIDSNKPLAELMEEEDEKQEEEKQEEQKQEEEKAGEKKEEAQEESE